VKSGSHAGSKIGGRTNTAGNLNTPTSTYLDKCIKNNKVQILGIDRSPLTGLLWQSEVIKPIELIQFLAL
jgi:hypothetical protein